MTHKDLDDFIDRLMNMHEEEYLQTSQEILIPVGQEYQDAWDKAIEDFMSKK